MGNIHAASTEAGLLYTEVHEPLRSEEPRQNRLQPKNTPTALHQEASSAEILPHDCAKLELLPYTRTRIKTKNIFTTTNKTQDWSNELTEGTHLRGTGVHDEQAHLLEPANQHYTVEKQHSHPDVFSGTIVQCKLSTYTVFFWQRLYFMRHTF